MKLKFLIWIICCLSAVVCQAQDKQEYIFFIHNAFLETHTLEEEHPEYGRTEYREIIQAFEREGFVVMSEIRPGKVDAKAYARKLKTQIDSLLLRGVAPNNITIIGTSKGGYIAQYVSTYLKNPDVNFVFVACYRDSDIENFKDIDFCGNILTIYEQTDEWGVSALRRKETSGLPINAFKEIEINTGLRHGFIFKPLEAWIQPSIQWAKGNYQLN